MNINMEDQLEGVREIQRGQHELLKSMHRAMEGFQRQAESTHRVLGYLAQALDLLTDDSRPEVRAFSDKARVEVAELERIAALPGDASKRRTGLTGTIRSFDGRRGFGFIRLPGDGPDDRGIFFHANSLCSGPRGVRQGLPMGCRVLFDLVEGDGGRSQAANVRTLPFAEDGGKSL